jgi:hypothetical protein
VIAGLVLSLPCLLAVEVSWITLHKIKEFIFHYIYIYVLLMLLVMVLILCF